MPLIIPGIRARPVDKDDLPAAANRELIPVLRACREAINKHLGLPRSVSGSYRVQLDDGLLVVDTSGGNATITLPDPDTFRQRLIVKNDGSGTVTISHATALIDGSSSLTLTTDQESVLIDEDDDAFWAHRGSAFILPPGNDVGDILEWDGTSWQPVPNAAPYTTSAETRPALRFESASDSANRAVANLWKASFCLLLAPLKFNSISWANGTNTQEITFYFYQAESGGLTPPFLYLGHITVTPTASIIQTSKDLALDMRAVGGHLLVAFASASDGSLSQGPRCWNTAAGGIGEAGVVGTDWAAGNALLADQFPLESQLAIAYTTSPPAQIVYADISSTDTSDNLPRGRLEYRTT